MAAAAAGLGSGVGVVAERCFLSGDVVWQRRRRSSSQPAKGRAVAMAAPSGGAGAVASDAAATTAPSRAAEDFVRPHMRRLAAYTPIEPFEVLSKRLGRAPAEIVKLDANENPYGPPPEVLEALGNMQFPHIYPDPESRQLRAALAEDTGVPKENILVGCGADELIDLLMRCVLDPGDAIVDCPPTFTMYAFDADVNNARVVKVPRLPDFRIDTAAVEAAVAAHQPKMVFLTSPNNPDGSVMSDEDLLRVLRLPVLVVLDEAYVEFATEPSRSPWVLKHDNLVVLRTFSKRAGLAGLRVGYGMFPSGLIKYLWRAKQPYNVSVAAEVAACAALQNKAYLESVKNKLLSERDRLMGLLKDIPFLTPFPSAANFVLCRTEGRDAGELKAALMKEGVMVRHYNKPELSGYIRISVGRPDQTDALMAAIAKVS
eukprot:jgi/Chlat1/7739/Chrsp66S07216